MICWEEGSLLSPSPAHQQTQHSHLWKHPDASPFSPASLPAWSRHHCGQDVLPTPGRLPCTCLTPLRSFSTWQPERPVRASQEEVRGVFSRPPSASTPCRGSQVPAVPVWAITSLMQLQPPALKPTCRALHWPTLFLGHSLLQQLQRGPSLLKPLLMSVPAYPVANSNAPRLISWPFHVDCHLPLQATLISRPTCGVTAKSLVCHVAHAPQNSY